MISHAKRGGPAHLLELVAFRRKAGLALSTACASRERKIDVSSRRNTAVIPLCEVFLHGRSCILPESLRETLDPPHVDSPQLRLDAEARFTRASADGRAIIGRGITAGQGFPKIFQDASSRIAVVLCAGVDLATKLFLASPLVRRSDAATGFPRRGRSIAGGAGRSR